MNRYHARDLLNMAEDDLWALPEERHIVVFDDGELETHTRATITSVYLWYPVLKFEGMSLKTDYHLGSRRFTSKRMLQILNTVVWDIHAAMDEAVDSEHLAFLCMSTVNRFYNVFTVRLSAYVATMSLIDMVEIMEHPAIAKANAEVKPTQHSIEDQCYPTITKELMEAPELSGNPVAEGCRSGTQKMGQVLQCVGPIGYRTDIGSQIFQNPIMTGFVQGQNTLHDNMIESRSGAKSLLYNKYLLRNTEYFNRKTQLVAQYVQNLHMGDCGTPHTIRVPVLENLLPQMRGKYYKKPDGGLDWLRGDEKHLIGQEIEVRSVMGCTHSDPGGVCLTCYGRLGFSIPHGTNIGQVSAVSMGDKITSSVLSTKHLDSTARVEKFRLSGTEKEYLRIPKDDEVLYLKESLHKKSLKVTVLKDEANSLADVLMLPDLAEYDVANATQFTQIMLTTYDGNGQEEDNDVLTVSLYNRRSSFSREMLEHIKRVRWVNDEKGNPVIDISSFDVNKPFLVLPFKHVNMYEVMVRIQSFLHSGSDSESKKLGRGRKRKKDKEVKPNYLKDYRRNPVDGLVVLFQMLNEKLSINLVHCEILAYAMMVRSSADRDYRLPVPGISGMYEKYSVLMENRSLSAAMAFEKQDRPLINTQSFLQTRRNDHPYDMLLMGGKV